MDPRRKAGGQPEDESWMVWGRFTPVNTAARAAWGLFGDELGTGWGRPGDRAESTARNPPNGIHSDPYKVHSGGSPARRMRTTRGQQGDIMRTRCGDRFAVLRAARPVHRQRTASVDHDAPLHLRKLRPSTFSTAPMTSTALSLHSRMNSPQVRTWGSTDPRSSLEIFHHTLNPKPAGGGSR